jgi:hypothetical protein
MPASGAGGFTVTAYCPCALCCGSWANHPWETRRLASGKLIAPLVAARAKWCAAPPEIPFGTILDIPGYGKVPVLDRGGKIKGNKLDMFFPTHAEALRWGVRRLEVKRRRR